MQGYHHILVFASSEPVRLGKLVAPSVSAVAAYIVFV